MVEEVLLEEFLKDKRITEGVATLMNHLINRDFAALGFADDLLRVGAVNEMLDAQPVNFPFIPWNKELAESYVMKIQDMYVFTTSMLQDHPERPLSDILVEFEIVLDPFNIEIGIVTY
jgi:hypothetical protein